MNRARNREHEKLIEIGYVWLIKSIKCSFAFKNLISYAKEKPDLIGWKNQDSILIECKTSRSDFLADKKKSFRIHGNMGVGNYRFYLVPESLLNIDDIPEKWGWLAVNEKGKIRKCLFPKGNVWNNESRFESHLPSERVMLCSALRRIQKQTCIQNFLK